MHDALEFVQDNWIPISAAVGAVLAVGTLIAKKTKTKVDDQVVSWLERIFGWFGKGKK